MSNKLRVMTVRLLSFQSLEDRKILRNDIMNPENRHKKTTFRWFYDTAYCFDYSVFFPWYPERDLNPHSANAEGF